MATTPKAGDTIAIMDTSHGTMKILLYTEHVPETTKNFIEHSNEGRYNDAPFHRIIKDFMIQGGDFENQNGTGGYSYKGPGTSIPDEFHDDLSHIKGALSMANSGPNTGGSQFFIVQNEDGTAFLDGRHAVFGYIYDGLDNVDKIADIETDGGDRPSEPVLIKTITISEYK
ncbi:peptidylprolyl isomerase [Candidatus Gracilibacteria bacterium]|nr:peptidylprolyl isomerase [Candidatus Gracilibacteria bacterium]